MSELVTLLEVGGPAVALGGGAAYLRARHPAAYWSAVGLPVSTARLLGSYSSVMDACGLPWRLDQVDGAPFAAGRLLEHMVQDKKAEGGRPVLVLARRIGDAFVARDVDAARLRDFLIEQGATP